MTEITWNVIRRTPEPAGDWEFGRYIQDVPTEHATYVGPPLMRRSFGPYRSPIDAIRACAVRLEDDDGTV